MTIQHHPSEQSIFAYANGALQRTLALALGAHLETCAECRQSLGVAQALGGLLLEEMPPAELSADAFADVLERLEIQAPQPQPRSAAILPFILRHQQVGRRRWLAPGIWIRPILKQDDERVYLLGAAAGKTLPRHGHKGLEMTQVLEGEFFDGGTRYGPGDFLEAGDDVEHALLVGAQGTCICVVASEGVPRGLPGLLMRLVA